MSAAVDEKTAAAQNGGEVKRLSSEQVRHSDAVRDKAESQAGKRGPGRPKGSKTTPKASSPEEAAKQAKARREKEAAKKTAEQTYQEPSDADVRKFRRMIAVSNKPLEKIEAAIMLKAQVLGCDSVNGEPLLRKGDLMLSDEELDFHAECAAGTAALISPAIARWIPLVGLVVGGGAFVLSRGIVISRCNSVFAEVEKLHAANQKAQEPELKPADVVSVK